MSVILFSRQEVFQEMADAYEGLKHLLLTNSQEEDYKFYKSLRRLYFANVATYLCQYHDDTPLSEDELKGIEPFDEIEGQIQPFSTNLTNLHAFLCAWGSLQYNLVTNDGERYQAKDACAYLSSLAESLCRAVIEKLAEKQQ